MKRLLGFIGLLIMCQLTQAQTTIVQGLQINGAKGAAPSTAIPSNGGIAIFDANGVLKKTTVLASLGNKLTSVTQLNDSTITVTGDGGSTTVLIRGLFTNSRQRWFDSLRTGLVFDTISVHQVGAGINSIYSNSAGTTILVKGLQGSTTIEVQRASDSSLIFNSLLNFTRSVTILSGGVNVGLVGDLTTPTDGSVYGIQAGSKGWFLVSSFPIATNTTNGIFDFHEKLRLDSSVVMTNYTNGGLFDSIAVASPTLDSVIFKGQKFRGQTGSGLSVSNVGNVFANDYVFDFSWKSVQASVTADGTSTVYNVAHGLSGVTSSSPVTVTPRNALAASQPYFVTATSTNVVITFTTAPSAGSMLFSYIIRP